VGEQEAGVLPVFLECVPELLAEQLLFSFSFQAVPGQHQPNAHNAPPLVDHHSRTEGRENDAGLDWVPRTGIRASADELMVLFERDPGAPIFRQMVARPDRQADAQPGKGHAQNRTGQSAGQDFIP
jgi:hypothetical protein